MKRTSSQAGFKQKYRKGNLKKRRVVKAPRRATPKVNLRTGGYVGTSKKFVEGYNTGTAIVNGTTCAGGEVDTPTQNMLFGVAQTNGESGRSGDKARITSVHITGTVTCTAQANQTATDVGTKVYIALVLDSQTNGAQLNSEDVFTNYSATASLCANPTRNMQYSKRFKVIKTKTMLFSNPSITFDGTNLEQSGLIQDFDIYVETDVIQQYISNGLNVTDLLDNSFHLIAFCSSTALAPTIQYNCRARFIDMN